jgi:VWFA-related protein
MRAILATMCALSLDLATGQNPERVAQNTSPALRSQSSLVLVPTLVTNKSGEIVYGLSAKDFIIEDNGVEQQPRLSETPDTQFISLVVAVQVGGSASLVEFDQTKKPSVDDSESSQWHKTRKGALNGLGAMVVGFIGESKSEVAVVTFDSHVELLQDFDENLTAVEAKIRNLKASGKDASAILDAVSYSIRLLEQRPKDRTKVLLVIGEPRDHGSKAKIDEVLKRITESNTVVYSLSFSPLRAETVRDLRGQHPDAPVPADLDPSEPPDTDVATIDFLAMAYLASNALRKNTARAVADLTGGEYSTFKDGRTFDDSLAALTGNLRDRYFLSFEPKNPKPGLHSIIVRLKEPRRDVTVLARNRYWALGSVGR